MHPGPACWPRASSAPRLAHGAPTTSGRSPSTRVAVGHARSASSRRSCTGATRSTSPRPSTSPSLARFWPPPLRSSPPPPDPRPARSAPDRRRLRALHGEAVRLRPAKREGPQVARRMSGLDAALEADARAGPGHRSGAAGANMDGTRDRREAGTPAGIDSTGSRVGSVQHRVAVHGAVLQGADEHRASLGDRHASAAQPDQLRRA